LQPKITADLIRNRKGSNQPIAALTAYDYPTAKLLDEAGIDLLLVGDSVGTTVLGYPDTTHVRLEGIIHHVRPVARAVSHALVVADLPIDTYTTPDLAVASARRLIEAGAEAVKLEGGQACFAQIKAITKAGIPFLGHIGMLPQHVLEEGGYKIKGKTPEQREFLLREAKAVEEAGGFAVVLELVKSDVAGEIRKAVAIPTIGIGAGNDCDGQILVTHDLIGFFPWFTPKHVKPEASVGEAIRNAAKAYIKRIQESAISNRN
jgi:3-methyl-2-oxobutanoate hydroxymethyltransferase